MEKANNVKSYNNGQEQIVTGYDVATSDSSYTTADFTFSGNDIAKGTDAGSYPMELTAADFTNTNENRGARHTDDHTGYRGI